MATRLLVAAAATAATWAAASAAVAAVGGDSDPEAAGRCERCARHAAVEDSLQGGAAALSMLQRLAGHGSSAAGQEPRQQTLDSAAGGGDGRESIPARQTFRDVRMLYLKLPLSSAVLQRGLVGGLLGEHVDAQHGGFQLDESECAHVRIAYYPDAQIGWSSSFGDSTPENLPHHLLSVHLPMLQAGQKLYQTSFALVDDDRAMMLYRLGHGVPAKLANISFPSSGSFPEGQMMNVSRRGLNMLLVEGLHNEGDADLEAVAELFQHPEINYGTDLGNNIAQMSPMHPPAGVPYKKRVTEASVKSAWRVSTSLAASDGTLEVFRSIFADMEPLEAYWLQADLDVTTSLFEATPAFAAPARWPNITDWRIRGEITTDKRGRPGDFPRMAYKNGHIIWMHLKIDPEKVAPYLPPPLKLADDVGVLWHTRWEPADPANMWGMQNSKEDFYPLEYNELWVSMPVSVEGRQYMYPVLMLLDDDVAQMLGQDAIGCPKKLANLTYTFSPEPGPNSQVLLDISRHGRQVVRVTGRITDRERGPAFGVNDHRQASSDTLWMVSHQFPWDPEVDRPRFVPCQSAERTYDQREMTDIEVTLGTSPQEPLAEWFVGPPLEAGYIKMDQDWLPSFRSPMSMLLMPIDAEGFTAWWKRAFALMYM